VAAADQRRRKAHRRRLTRRRTIIAFGAAFGMTGAAMAPAGSAHESFLQGRLPVATQDQKVVPVREDLETFGPLLQLHID
jgi:hypothetical protein